MLVPYSTYHVVGRPQSFYVDRSGIYREIQIGQVTDADFERKYASITEFHTHTPAPPKH